MRAAVVTDFRSPLQVQDLPIPEPGAGEVLVRIETSGLCHTDIHAAHGDWPVKPTPPFIPGHEGVGYVEKLGAGVSTRAIGDRVAIAGSVTRAVSAATATAGGRRCARSSRTRATPSTAHSPSTPSSPRRSPRRYQTASPPATPRR